MECIVSFTRWLCPRGWTGWLYSRAESGGELCLGKGRSSSTFKQHSGGTSCMQVSSTEDVNTKFSCSHCEFPSLAGLQGAEDTGWLCPFLSPALTIFLPLPSDGPLALGKECGTGVPALAEHSRHPFSTPRLGSGLLPRVLKLPGLATGCRIPPEAISQAQPSRNCLTTLLPRSVCDEIWTSDLCCPAGVPVNEMSLLCE